MKSIKKYAYIQEQNTDSLTIPDHDTMKLQQNLQGVTLSIFFLGKLSWVEYLTAYSTNFSLNLNAVYL